MEQDFFIFSPLLKLGGAGGGTLAVHHLLAGQQGFFAFAEVRVIHTAVNRANGRALRLVVKAYALCTLISNNIICVHSLRGLRGVSVNRWVANSANFTF